MFATWQGNPVAEATVYAIASGNMRGRVPRFRTDANGIVLLKDLRPGKYEVHAFKESEGYADTLFAFFSPPNTKAWLFAEVVPRTYIFKMAENPGEYEFKLLWNNKLARSIKFTVGPDGKLDNGIATANKLGTGRVIVPVTIIGDQDGLWDKNAWKTDAFYGNPLSGFTAPQ